MFNLKTFFFSFFLPCFSMKDDKWDDFFEQYDKGPYSCVFFYEPEKKDSYDVNAFLKWCEIISDEKGERVPMPKFQIKLA
jgi:hypothetical protein